MLLKHSSEELICLVTASGMEDRDRNSETATGSACGNTASKHEDCSRLMSENGPEEPTPESRSEDREDVEGLPTLAVDRRTETQL